MVELSKILKDEAWLESEKRGTSVPLRDKEIYERSIKIWESEYEKQNKNVGSTEDDYFSI
jgi:hypothetical protein